MSNYLTVLVCDFAQRSYIIHSFIHSLMNVPSSVNAGAVSRYCRILRSFSNGHSTFFQVMNSLTCLASSQNFWNKTTDRQHRLIFMCLRGHTTQSLHDLLLYSVPHIMSQMVTFFITVTLPLSKETLQGSTEAAQWMTVLHCGYSQLLSSVNVFKYTVLKS